MLTWLKAAHIKKEEMHRSFQLTLLIPMFKLFVHILGAVLWHPRLQQCHVGTTESHRKSDQLTEVVHLPASPCGARPDWQSSAVTEV